MKSVLLDTNTLMLYILGNTDQRLVGNHKRLRSFDADDLDNLNNLLPTFQRHVSLPNVLTETSNLLGEPNSSKPGSVGYNFASYCNFVSEVYQESKAIAGNRAFNRLGLTDAAIVEIGKRDITVLTTDHALFGFLQAVGIDAVNIFHFKTPR